MQGQQLMPHQIIPRFQRRWNLCRPLTRGQHDPEPPLAFVDGSRDEAGFIDLEPDGAFAVVGAEGVANAREVDGYGAFGVRPLLPEGGDAAAGGDGSDLCGGAGAGGVA